MSSQPAYCFLGFRLDPSARLLANCGRRIAIQDKPFDLILYLIVHRDRVVSREELLREVWRGISVSPQALGFALHSARSALGDDGKHQSVLRTVVNKGIQFIASVTLEPARSGVGGTAQLSRAIPFLNRERLHRVVGAAIAEVLEARGQTLLLHGEPGIGKTRSLELISGIAGRQGFRILRGHGLHGNQAPPYWPWVQVLRAAIGSASRDLGYALLTDGAVQLTSLIPELQAPPESSSGFLEDATSTRFLMFDRVSTFIRTAALESPLCILIDDMHYADTGSIALFEHLARDLREAQVLLAGTYRSGGARVLSEVAFSIAGPDQTIDCRFIELNALPIEGIRTFIEAAYETTPSPTVLQLLYSTTNGNPFFLGQLLRVLEVEGRLSELEGDEEPQIELPRHVQLAIRRQISFLSDEVLRVLEVGSVAGRDFRGSEVQRALAVEPSACSNSLDVAVDAGVLKLGTRSPGVYSFTHSLMRDALYNLLPTGERLRLHAALGIAIEADGGSAIGPRAAELAYHFTRSAEILGVDRSLKYLEAAAVWASQRAGFEEAVAHLEEANALLISNGQHDDPIRSSILVGLGEAKTRSGDRPGGREALLEASRIAIATGRPDLIAAAALRYAPDFLALETGVCDADGVAIIEDALAANSTADRALRAQLLAKLAVALHWSDEAAQRRETAIEEANQLASTYGDPSVLSFVSTASCLAGFSIDHPRELVERTKELRDPTDPLTALVRRLIRITAFWLLGDMIRVREDVEEFGAAARRLRQQQAVWYELLLRATLAQMEGRFAQAEELRKQFLREGELAGDRNARHSYMLQAFMQSLDAGRVEEFEDGVREMVESFPRVLGWRAGLLLLLAETGRLPEADAALEQLVAEGALSKAKRNEWYALIGAMAIVAARTRNFRCAEMLYELLEPYRDQFAVVGYGSFCWGSTEQLLGLCATALRETNLARTHFTNAIARNRAVGSLPAVARAHRDLALCLVGAGEKAEAKVHCGEAGRLAAQLGMSRVAQHTLVISDSLMR